MPIDLSLAAIARLRHACEPDPLVEVIGEPARMVDVPAFEGLGWNLVHVEPTDGVTHPLV